MWIKEFFVDSDKKFQPIYFWITLIITLIVTGIILKYIEDRKLSDTLILGLMGFISALLALYKFKGIQNEKDKMDREKPHTMDDNHSNM